MKEEREGFSSSHSQLGGLGIYPVLSGICKEYGDGSQIN